MPEPFHAFNFSVELSLPGAGEPLCSAAFSECDGLEMSFDVKSVREGGNNGAQLRLTGPATFGQVTLKRGMTASFDLWDWCSSVVQNPALRADGQVVVLAADGETERVRFLLRRCLPVKVKAPPLNAKDGVVAIEELQLAYDTLTLERPQGGPGA
jgi:phage tail-like protein